ncbi:MAG: SBBP repeat-containing protein [candidate division WOR-3 bacterium]
MRNYQKVISIITLTLFGFGFSENETTTQNIRYWLNTYKGFEPNLGQVGDFSGKSVDKVLFSTSDNGLGVFVTETGVSYVIYRPERIIKEYDSQTLKGHRLEEEKLHYARVDLQLINANIAKEKIVYDDELPGYSNYYLSHCPNGILFVKSYQKIRIKEIYPKIDWVWKYEDGILHHEFEVAPDAKIEDIKLKVKWAEVEVKDGNQILFKTPLGEIQDGRIRVYEGKAERAVQYQLEDGLITFSVKGWQRKESLIIDPPLSLLWATYYGGSLMDWGFSITSDDSGNIFLTGESRSDDFPTYNPGGGTYYQGTTGGGADVFVLKFNNQGVRFWATYYGGNYSDVGYSITTDAIGNIFVIGSTLSDNFPTYNPGGGAYYQENNAGSHDGFILKFNNQGLRLWATYYGGSGIDLAYSVKTDSLGNLFVAGTTLSSDFPIQNPGGGVYYQGNNAGGYDIFILKFNNQGARLWATYYGGNDYDGYWRVAITTDISGNIFLTGETKSLDLPIYNPGGGVYYQGNNAGLMDVFILKFNNQGARLWATYYGGSNDDQGWPITSDASGNIFVAGLTFSENFPTHNPGGGAYYQGTNRGSADIFILKFDNQGVRLWATYYGGSLSDVGYSIVTDVSGNLFVTGSTFSENLPTYNPGSGAHYQGANAGYFDAFIIGFNNQGSRLWATYYGGSSYDRGHSITTDVVGNIFVTGEVNSTDFPVYNPGGGTYYQGTNSGNYDAFIAKFERAPIGIAENKTVRIEHELLLVPLFFDDAIELKHNSLKPSLIEVRLYNSLGNNVFTRVYPNQERILISGAELQTLPTGAYFLFVYMGSKELGKARLIKLER